MSITENGLFDIIIKGITINNPVFQIIEFRESHNKQIKIALNDRFHHYSAILTSQVRDLYDNQKITQNCLMCLQKYVVNNNSDKPTLIILNAAIIDSSLTSMLGKPAPLSFNDIPVPKNISPPSKSESIPITPNPIQQMPNIPKYEPKNFQQTNSNEIRPLIQPKNPYSSMSISEYNSSIIIPIRNLTAYSANWSIVARIIEKSSMRTYTTGKGGKLFTVTLKDEFGDLIRGTFFNDPADNWYPRLIQDCVYRISGGKLKAKNSIYNKLPHDYEITFDESSNFIQIENTSIGKLEYQFVKISEIEKFQKDSSIDVIGIVINNEPVVQIKTKKNTILSRRKIEIVDESKVSIEVTLWGDDADIFPDGLHKIICIHDARINEFNGKNLSASSGSIKIDPTIPETMKLQNWWTNIGNNSTFQKNSTSEQTINHLSLIQEQQLGINEKVDYLTSYILLTDIPESKKKFHYPACPNVECKNKGLTINEDGTFTCSRCHQNTKDPSYKYNFLMKISDFSGSAYSNIVCNDSIGELVFGLKIKDLVTKVKDLDDSSIRSFVQPFFFKHFKIKNRIKTDNFQNEDRVKLTAVSCEKASFSEMAKFYASEINKLY